ncbi:hypothetical protein [Nonomuraea endophytica]|uniref:hypothetical protein n=1 Tax=Nonomuraea endophytica TaxID=714136 RepID=UPI0037C638BB
MDPRDWMCAFSKSSITQRADLDFAIALGEDRFNFHLMTNRQAALLATAAIRSLDPRAAHWHPHREDLTVADHS